MLYPSEVRVIHEFLIFIVIYFTCSIFYAFGAGEMSFLNPWMAIGWRYVVRPLVYFCVGFYIWARYL